MAARRAVLLSIVVVVVIALAASYRLRLHAPAASPTPPPAATPRPAAAPGAQSRTLEAQSRKIAAAPAAVDLRRSETDALGSATSFVAVVRGRQRLRLDAQKSGDALAAVRRVLDGVGTLTPERRGVRLLTELRLNDYLVDVTVWTPQTLVVGGSRLTDVAGIVIPFTGAWRHRVLIDRGGAVEASPPLLDSPDLAALERLVDSSGTRP